MQNYATVSPCNQALFKQKSGITGIYQSQQAKFREIKNRNGMKGENVKRAITPEGRPEKSDQAKESMLISSINEISIDNQARKLNAEKRCLTTQLGDRLRQSAKPSSGEVVYNLKTHKRIAKIEDSIFVDDKESRNPDRTLNQIMDSKQNPLNIRQRSRSPTFGGCQERSMSANNRQV